jgi:hypothetical protein
MPSSPVNGRLNLNARLGVNSDLGLVLSETTPSGASVNSPPKLGDGPRGSTPPPTRLSPGEGGVAHPQLADLLRTGYTTSACIATE